MYEIDKGLEELAAKVIAEHEELRHLDDDCLNIVYLRTDKQKTGRGKKVYADTEKLNEKHSAMTGALFMPRSTSPVQRGTIQGGEQMDDKPGT